MIASPEKIGRVRFAETQRVRKFYEYAAWWSDLDCPPQECEVFMTRQAEGWPQFVFYSLKGTCVAAYLASHFGGVPFGKDEAGKRAIGQADTVSVHLQNHSLAQVAGLDLDPAYRFMAGRYDSPEYHRAVADYKLAIAIHCRISLRTAMNEAFLEQHGSPQLWAKYREVVYRVAAA